MTRDEFDQFMATIAECWPRWEQTSERQRQLWSIFNQFRVVDCVRAVRRYFDENPDGWPKWKPVRELVRRTGHEDHYDVPRWSWRDENVLRNIMAERWRHTPIEERPPLHQRERDILCEFADRFSETNPTPAQRTEASDAIERIRKGVRR